MDQQQNSEAAPLVSIIIPCYNHGRFLGKALASVQRQLYPATEIIVVDDGSTDNTREVAQAFSSVRYIYQPNQGLSAARNTGIRHSTGAYLVFLDADDWLFPQALSLNIAYLQQEPAAAFVSGGYMCIYEDENRIYPIQRSVEAEHYLQLLRGNYLGMPAVAMYQRWVFDEFLYDTALNICSDYDLCLRVARHYPVLHHTGYIAAYRQHRNNMSSNIPKMLNSILQSLRQHKPQLKTKIEKRAYAEGIRYWKSYYCLNLYYRLRTKQVAFSTTVISTLLYNSPSLLVKASILNLLPLNKSATTQRPS